MRRVAIAATRNATAAAFFVAGVTGLLATLALFDVWNVIAPSALLDAVLFLAIGLGIRLKYSRFAAVSGLLLYLLEIASRIAEPGVRTNSPVNGMTIIFIFFFMSGVRGTFAYANLKQTNDDFHA